MHKTKQRAELIMYITAIFLSAGGTALCLAGLLIPHWYNLNIKVGQDVVNSSYLGLWQDELCVVNQTCVSYWLIDDSYTRPANLIFPNWKLIQGFETAGTAVAILSLFSIVLLLIYYNRGTRPRVVSFSFFYITSFLAGFLITIGCLISSKGDIENFDYGPLVSGVGGSLILISLGMSCAICRYDPTYGTLENPVSPSFRHA